MFYPGANHFSHESIASSNQRHTALVTYWTTRLGQSVDDLSTFLAALSASPMLLPFDPMFSRQGHSLADTLTNSSLNPFPPPLACYPGLLLSETTRISQIEGPVFGLAAINSWDKFDPACYADRPVYGALNVLRLRLPYDNALTNAPRQAVVLNHDVSSRVVIWVGEYLSRPSNESTDTGISLTAPDPWSYGTLSYSSHVVLQYLKAIPSVDLAIALVRFILSAATSTILPPAESSLLFQGLESIPMLEIAVFGSINPTNTRAVVSAFGDPSGNLFFGSTQASRLRDWTINAAKSPILWAENTTSPEIVRDQVLDDADFNRVWDAAVLANQNPAPQTGVWNVTASFAALGKYSSN